MYFIYTKMKNQLINYSKVAFLLYVTMEDGTHCICATEQKTDLGRTLWSTSVSVSCLFLCRPWRSTSSLNNRQSCDRPVSLSRKVLSERKRNSARGMLSTGTGILLQSRLYEMTTLMMNKTIIQNYHVYYLWHKFSSTSEQKRLIRLGIAYLWKKVGEGQGWYHGVHITSLITHYDMQPWAVLTTTLRMKQNSVTDCWTNIGQEFITCNSKPSS